MSKNNEKISEIIELFEIFIGNLNTNCLKNLIAKLINSLKENNGVISITNTYGVCEEIRAEFSQTLTVLQDTKRLWAKTLNLLDEFFISFTGENDFWDNDYFANDCMNECQEIELTPETISENTKRKEELN